MWPWSSNDHESALKCGSSTYAVFSRWRDRLSLFVARANHKCFTATCEACEEKKYTLASFSSWWSRPWLKKRFEKQVVVLEDGLYTDKLKENAGAEEGKVTKDTSSRWSCMIKTWQRLKSICWFRIKMTIIIIIILICIEPFIQEMLLKVLQNKEIACECFKHIRLWRHMRAGREKIKLKLWRIKTDM